MEVAAGRDAEGVEGGVSGLYKVNNWVQVPHLSGTV